jgi:hypothetical protein
MNVNHRTTFGKGVKKGVARGEGKFDQMRHVGGDWFLLVRGEWWLATPGPMGETVNDLARKPEVTITAQSL